MERKKDSNLQLARLMSVCRDDEKFIDMISNMTEVELDEVAGSFRRIAKSINEREITRLLEIIVKDLDRRITIQERLLGIGIGVRKSLDICDNYNFASGKSYEEEEEDSFPSLDVDEMFSGR